MSFRRLNSGRRLRSGSTSSTAATAAAATAAAAAPSSGTGTGTGTATGSGHGSSDMHKQASNDADGANANGSELLSALRNELQSHAILEKHIAQTPGAAKLIRVATARKGLFGAGLPKRTSILERAQHRSLDTVEEDDSGSDSDSDPYSYSHSYPDTHAGTQESISTIKQAPATVPESVPEAETQTDADSEETQKGNEWRKVLWRIRQKVRGINLFTSKMSTPAAAAAKVTADADTQDLRQVNQTTDGHVTVLPTGIRSKSDASQSTVTFRRAAQSLQTHQYSIKQKEESSNSQSEFGIRPSSGKLDDDLEDYADEIPQWVIDQQQNNARTTRAAASSSSNGSRRKDPLMEFTSEEVLLTHAMTQATEATEAAQASQTSSSTSKSKSIDKTTDSDTLSSKPKKDETNATRFMCGQLMIKRDYDRLIEALLTPISTRTPADINRIANVVQDLLFFDNLPFDIVCRMCRLAQIQFVRKRRAVYYQGAESDSMYIVCSGSVEVSVKVSSHTSYVACRLYEGESFGEAVLHANGQNISNRETVIAMEHTELLVLPKRVGNIIRNFEAMTRRDMHSVFTHRNLNGVFSNLPDDVLDRIVQASTVHSFTRGEIVIREQSPCFSLYIIKRGFCAVLREPTGLKGGRNHVFSPAEVQPIQLGILTAGQCFGRLDSQLVPDDAADFLKGFSHESTLAMGDPHNANNTAATSTHNTKTNSTITEDAVKDTARRFKSGRRASTVVMASSNNTKRRSRRGRNGAVAAVPETISTSALLPGNSLEMRATIQCTTDAEIIVVPMHVLMENTVPNRVQLIAAVEKLQDALHVPDDVIPHAAIRAHRWLKFRQKTLQHVLSDNELRAAQQAVKSGIFSSNKYAQGYHNKTNHATMAGTGQGGTTSKFAHNNSSTRSLDHNGRNHTKNKKRSSYWSRSKRAKKNLLAFAVANDILPSKDGWICRTSGEKLASSDAKSVEHVMSWINARIRSRIKTRSMSQMSFNMNSQPCHTHDQSQSLCSKDDCESITSSIAHVRRAEHQLQAKVEAAAAGPRNRCASHGRSVERVSSQTGTVAAKSQADHDFLSLNEAMMAARKRRTVQMPRNPYSDHVRSMPILKTVSQQNKKQMKQMKHMKHQRQRQQMHTATGAQILDCESEGPLDSTILMHSQSQSSMELQLQLNQIESWDTSSLIRRLQNRYSRSTHISTQ
jgi:CRP-like cAMP-binding protein